MKTLYRPMCDILKEAGYETLRCHASHEIMGRGVDRVTVDKHMRDRNLANRVLKQAGIEKRL